MFRNDTCVASAANHVSTAKRMKEDGHTAKDIAKYLGGSRATLYRYLAQDGADVAARP
jgi:predicted transcriptional regulator